MSSETPFVPERLTAAMAALPDDYVIVPRFCVENIRDAAWVDLKARDGYGGVVIATENALDGFWFYHMFLSGLIGDYDLYEEFYAPQPETGTHDDAGQPAEGGVTG